MTSALADSLSQLSSKVKRLIHHPPVNSFDNSLPGEYNYGFYDKSLVERKTMGDLIRRQYPDRIPIIIDRSRDIPKLDKYKYLVPDNITIPEFLHVLRKRLHLSAEKALFVVIKHENGYMSYPTGTESLRDIYFTSKGEDHFLRVLIQSESTFG